MRAAVRGAAFLTALSLVLVTAMGAMAAPYTVETVPNVRLQDESAHVTDPDNILGNEKAAINSALADLERKTGVEAAVVALSDIGDQDPREFATALFNRWGLGKKGEDNGLLILLITDPAQRQVLFETGYGLEGVLPDAICYRLQQRYMVPDMRDGRYGEGMRKGVEAVTAYLLANGEERRAMTSPAPGAQTGPGELPLGTLLVLFGIPVAFAVFFARMQRRPKKCPRCGHKTYRFEGTQVAQSPTATMSGMATDVYRCSNCGYTNRFDRTLPPRGGGRGNAILAGAILGSILGGRGGGGGFGGGGFGGGSWGGGGSGGGGAGSRF